MITDISMNSWTAPLERWGVWSNADHRGTERWYCYYRVLTHEIAFTFSSNGNLNMDCCLWEDAIGFEYQYGKQCAEKPGNCLVKHKKKCLTSWRFCLCFSFLSFQGPFLLTLARYFLLLFIQPTLTLWCLNRLTARDFSVFVFRVVNSNGVIN